MKKIAYVNLLWCLLCTSIVAEQRPCCLVLFSHGIADTYRQASWYTKSRISNNVKVHNERYLFPCPVATFDYPDATEGRLRVNYHETSFGQSNEIGRLHSAYKQAKQWAYDQWNSCNIILFGVSRGASNLGIFAGTHSLKRVKAIILESPYFTMGEVLAHMLDRNHLSWIPLYYAERIAEFIFKKYDHTGKSPANTIEKIPLDTPILIVCTKEDHLVPWTSSFNVYKKLIESGHKNTHILILNHGRHARILPGIDGQKYQAVVHAFYQKYNLPHDPSIAEIGKEMLLQTQPDITEN